MMNKTAIGLLLPLLALGIGGCGVELVGGEQGDVKTYMTDDSGSGEASAERKDGPRFSRSAVGASQIVDATGTVSADVSVALIGGGGESFAVTSDPARGTVRIASRDSAQLGDKRLFAANYPSVRVTFVRVAAQLDAGILGPGGATLPLGIAVDLAGQPLVVEAPVQVVVRPNEVTKLEIDLNAAAWLVLADPLTGLVPRAAFADAVEVRVE